MAPPYFYTTERRLAHRSLTHKGLTISYRHPCAPYWRLTHSIPQRRMPMNRTTVLVSRKAHAVTSLVRRADGASPGHSWLAVVATKTCAYGTCGLGASLFPHIYRYCDSDPRTCVDSLTLYVLRGHTSTVRCLKVIHNRPIAISGSRDSTLRVWDVQRGRMLRILSGHSGSVRSLDVCGNRVVSGSYDGTCRVCRTTYLPTFRRVYFWWR